MGDRGNKYYAPTGETTEWEDILVKKGIIEARPKPEEEKIEIPEPATLEEQLQHASLEELEELEEDEGFDDEKMLQLYRERRIAEMKEKALRARFGDIYPIAKDEWVKEVTEGSKQCWVVVFLFKNGIIECDVMENALRVVAKKFKEVKFVKIVSTSAIENWPDRNLPTLFVYHDGDLRTQLLGLKEVGGKGMTPADLEWFLATKGVVQSDLEENPRSKRSDIHRKGAASRYRDDSDESDED